MPRGKNILILSPTPDTIGGVENYYNVLQLHNDDPRIEYLYVTGPKHESRLQFFRRLTANYIKFACLLRSGRYGLVILNPTLDTRSFFRDSVFCRLALAYHVTPLVFFRGWDASMEARIRRPGIAQLVFRTAFAKVQHFIVLGQTFRERLIGLGCNPEARYWIETTVADTRFASDFTIGERLIRNNCFRILFLGRLTKSKGPWRALQAFQNARSRSPDHDFELAIAGDGPELESLKTHVRTHDLHSVKVMGAVRDQAKADLLRSSDLLLLPTSAAEGMPNSVLEAMYFGLPVLTTSTGAIPEILRHGENGYLADNPDAAQFASWIVALADDRNKWLKMSRANHDVATSRFVDVVVRPRLKAIFDAILGQ